MSDLISQMRDLVREQDQIYNDTFDLWTWLPSSKYAELAHGDYASEFRFDIVDTIKEANLFIMALVSGDIKPHLRFIIDGNVTENTTLSFYNYEFFCPCGEIHRVNDTPHEDISDHRMKEIRAYLIDCDEIVASACDKNNEFKA